MDRIEKNEVSLLSHIIYTIYNTPDIAQMRLEVLQLLKYAVPFDTANFFLIREEDETNYTLYRSGQCEQPEKSGRRCCFKKVYENLF